MWPLIIIVASNCFYNICTKSMPEGINAFCALVVTYMTAAIITAALFIFDVYSVASKFSYQRNTP